MSKRMKILFGIVLIALAAFLLDRDQQAEEAAAVAEVERAYPDVRGVWDARRVVLESGEAHDLTGRLMLAERAWQTFYIVRDSAGTPRQATAEGGFYRPAVDTLHLSVDERMRRGEEVGSLPALPFSLDAGSEGEPLDSASVPIDVRGDTLDLLFPGWGRIEFVRAEGPVR